MPPRMIVVGLAVLLSCFVVSAGTVRAQGTADPVLEIPLYNGLIGIRTASTGWPTVRVYDRAGTLRASITPTIPRPADGHWVVELKRPGVNEPAIMLRPGLRIEVSIDGHTTSVTVPDMTASANVADDTVSGRVPPGSPAVYVQLHRDPEWLGASPDPAGTAHPVEADGSFSVSLAGRFDVLPGIWGEVATSDASGHVFITSFAPPSILVELVYDGPESYYYYAAVRADPHREPALSLLSTDGLELLRTTAAIRLGGPMFAFLLAEDGDMTNGMFVPRPGRRIALALDGAPAAEEAVPWTSATVDREERAVVGLAPPGSRVLVEAYTGQPGSAGDAPVGTAVVAADADGRFRADFPAFAPPPDAVARAFVHPGGSIAHRAVGRVLARTTALYGNRVSGVTAGRGSIEVELRSPTGERVAARTVETDPAGTFEAELYAGAGAVPAFSPGDRLVFRPEMGPTEDVIVPLLTARVDSGARVLHGKAPADHEVTSTVYQNDPPLFDPAPYGRASITLASRSGPAGEYVMRCESASCRMSYGILSVAHGATTFRLQWMDQPSVGVGATLATVGARATAGEPYTVTPLGPAGEPGVPRTGIVQPPLSERLPTMTVDMRDLYPDGLGTGDRLRIAIGARVVNVDVPAFSWQADVASNTVTGTAPAYRSVLVLALNYNDEQRAGAATAQGTAGVDGRWRAAFAGFDLRPGDDLNLYMPAEDHYLWWAEKAVIGEEPTATATAIPTSAPVPTGTPTPSRPKLFLPNVRRGW